VLAKAGQSLQLRLAFRGTPDYAFKPSPRLVLPEFSRPRLDGKVFLFRQACGNLPALGGPSPAVRR
jgi:hypothetical protein